MRFKYTNAIKRPEEGQSAFRCADDSSKSFGRAKESPVILRNRSFLARVLDTFLLSMNPGGTGLLQFI